MYACIWRRAHNDFSAFKTPPKCSDDDEALIRLASRVPLSLRPSGTLTICRPLNLPFYVLHFLVLLLAVALVSLSISALSRVRHHTRSSIRRNASSTLQKSWLHFSCFRFGICPFVHLSVSHCFHFAAALFLVSDKFLLNFFGFFFFFFFAVFQHYTVPSVFALIVLYFLLHLQHDWCSA